MKTTFFRRLPKPVLFGIFGAGGCLMGALLGEVVLQSLLPARQNHHVDILFVVDITASMTNEINGIKSGINNFVSQLKKHDTRVGLVTFGDECAGENPRVLQVEGESFTRNTEAFSRQVGYIQLNNGYDEPETSLEALIFGSSQHFNPDSTKVMVLITDAPPHVRGEVSDCIVSSHSVPSVNDVINALGQVHIDQLHLVVVPEVLTWFQDIHAAISGTVFPLEEAATDRQNFDKLLPQIGKQIAMAIGTGAVAAEHGSTLVVATAVWTAFVSVGTYLFLIAGQNYYLGRQFFRIDFVTIGSIVGVITAGLVSGSLGQLLMSALGENTILSANSRIIVWALLGSLMSRGLAFYIPNLLPLKASLGGLLGGTLGAIGFIWVTNSYFGVIIGDSLGRLTGAAILGFLIGLMISIIELIYREAWLEVKFGPREVRRVGLGAEPVSVGGDSSVCTVYTPGAAPKVFTFRMEQGKIMCDDIVGGSRNQISPGFERQVGNVWIAVCVPSKRSTIQTPLSTCPGGVPKQAAQAHMVQLSLKFSKNQVYPLTIGKRLSAKEIFGLESRSPDGAVAEVVRHPNDAQVLGLKNLSYRTWEAKLANESIRQVKAGRSVRLAAGTRINFGTMEGEIIE
jgi:Ca-activated chloride channel family protein